MAKAIAGFLSKNGFTDTKAFEAFVAKHRTLPEIDGDRAKKYAAYVEADVTEKMAKFEPEFLEAAKKHTGDIDDLPALERYEMLSAFHAIYTAGKGGAPAGGKGKTGIPGTEQKITATPSSAQSDLDAAYKGWLAGDNKARVKFMALRQQYPQLKPTQG